MNFLNNDFDASREPKLPSADLLRDYYLSTMKGPTSVLLEEPSPSDPYSDSSVMDGKAGLLDTLFWNTIVLSERSARYYSRNLLAYGVRAGMYAGGYIHISPKSIS